jgi:hypothetical protein
VLFVNLLDPLVTIGDPAKYIEINRTLQGHFDKVAALLKPPDKILVAFTPATPTPTTSDILIYFAPIEFSIVASFAGRKRDPLLDDGDGFTSIRTATVGRVTTTSAASEVYLKTFDSGLLAALAFHEAMHNKLALGNELHKRNGMAQEVVSAQTQVTRENAQQMAAAFRNPVTQFPRGVAVGLSAKARRDSGDPLWNL